MYRDISEKDIVKTLKEYDSRTKELRMEMSKQYAQLSAQDDDAMNTVIYPDMDNTKINYSNDFMDIVDIYEKYNKIVKQRVTDIKFAMREITEEQETMNRIMAAYSTLDIDEKEVLEKLYIKNKNISIQIMVQELAESYQLSDMSIYRIRKKAIKKIMELYNSDLTQTELFQYQTKNAVCLKENKYR